MPLSKWSSAVSSGKEDEKDVAVGGGRIVPALSDVTVGAGILPRASFRVDCKSRPRATSSGRRANSTDGRLEFGDGYPAGAIREMSRLVLPASNEGRAMKLEASSPMNLADELEGRVGGEGGAPDILRG